MKKVNYQLTNQVDCLKNESKELRNRLNVIEMESKSTRPRPKAKHIVQTVQALQVSSSTSITTNQQITRGKQEKSTMQLVNKKSHQAQIKVKSNNGNKAISSEVSQQKGQGQQHKQPSSQQQQQHSQKQQQLPVSQQQENKKKTVIMIAGDSIVKGQKGWLMSREKMVKVHSFSGATTDDMDFFLKPLLNREPDHLILHIGTNDQRGQNLEEIAKRIRLC